jgi:protocatechuate 3,4-dioxygenase beta subunit
MAVMKRGIILLVVPLVVGFILLYLYLNNAGYLCGQVSDETTGSPLAGATVTVGHRSVLTDADGRYHLEEVRGTLRVSVKAAGYRPLEEELARQRLLKGFVLNVALRPNRLWGTVVDELNGEPVAGATVQVDGRSIRTDSAGRYSVARIKDETTLAIEADGYLMWEGEVPDEDHLVEEEPFDIVLVPNTVVGTVRAEDIGEAVSGATVSWAEQKVQTDKEGSYTLRRVKAGAPISVRAEGYYETEVPFTVGDQLDIILRPTEVLVAVSDLFTGRSLAGVTVSVAGRSVQTDAAGQATFVRVSQGETFQAQAQDYAPTEAAYQGQGILKMALRPTILQGVVRDIHSGQPITGALIHLGETIATAGDDGAYELRDLPPEITLIVKASGYRKEKLTLGPATASDPSPSLIPCSASPCLDIALTPFEVKGLYIPFGILSRPEKVTEFVDLVDRTELNAIVVDVKSDRGFLAYRSQVPLAIEMGVGGERKDWLSLEELLKLCQDKDIYTIARIVVFKDNPLAHARPAWAVKRADGTVWLDREGLGWGIPSRQEVQDYNIAIAEEVAALGFDELQFDYIRFPSDGDVTAIVYDEEHTRETRSATIRAFMDRLTAELKPFGVFTSADVFGLTVWVEPYSDMGIGQRVQDIAPYVDYLCPMLYPATFEPRNLGHANPALHPYDVIYRSQLEAAKRVPVTTKVRPWLQHYSLNGVFYGPEQYQAQRQAADDAGSCGWTFWNAGGKYNVEFFEGKVEIAGAGGEK